MMIGTQLPRNNLDFPRGVRLSSCSTGRSRASMESNSTLQNIKIIGEHTCEGKSKDKSIGFADNQQHYDGCLVNCFVN
jgi:hypothetical protein